MTFEEYMRSRPNGYAVWDGGKLWKRMKEAWYAALQASESAPAPTNNASTPLPTLVEVEAHVQREKWSGAIDCESMNIVKVAYEFIARQRRAGG